MMWIIGWLALAIGAGAVASSKGRSGVGYFVLGLFLPLIGLLIAIGMAPLQKPVVQRPDDGILCHACGKPRRRDALHCPHCYTRQPDPHAGQKKCPACAEWILADARKCKHCGEIQTVTEPAVEPKYPAMNWKKADEIERSLDQRRR